MNDTTNGVRFDNDGTRIIIDGLTIGQGDVVTEARHWLTGQRGPRCDEPAELAAADLTQFATEALVLGSKTLSLTAQTTETRALERMLKDVGEQTAEATRKASDTTALAAKSATETVVRAAVDATKAITDADQVTRKRLTEAVASTRDEVLAETRRLFGGEHPELLERLQPVLASFSTALEKQVQTSTSELLARATKQLDPSDPTSPMAKQAAALAEQQRLFALQVEKGQDELGAKVDALSTALKVQDAKAALAKVTPIKGGSFENRLHVLMNDIAAGLGDEYEDTSTKTGQLPRCKKGDGLLLVADQSARVVIEMTDSARTSWGDYSPKPSATAAQPPHWVSCVRPIRTAATRSAFSASGGSSSPLTRTRTTPNCFVPSPCCCAQRRSPSRSAPAKRRSTPPRRRSARPSISSTRSTRSRRWPGRSSGAPSRSRANATRSRPTSAGSSTRPSPRSTVTSVATPPSMEQPDLIAGRSYPRSAGSVRVPTPRGCPSRRTRTS